KDAQLRVDFFRKRLETAKGKAKQDAQNKLNEKQTRIDEITELVKKTSVMAPRPGVVSKVLVKVGEAVTAGSEVSAVADKALSAGLKMARLEAQELKVGQEAKLSGPAGLPLAAKLVSAKPEGDMTTLVFSLPLDAASKPGDKLSLQRGMLEKVVRVPASALV